VVIRIIDIDEPDDEDAYFPTTYYIQMWSKARRVWGRDNMVDVGYLKEEYEPIDRLSATVLGILIDEEYDE